MSGEQVPPSAGKMKTWSESVSTYRGYRITASDSGYSVYKDGVCVAGGGVVFAGEKANREQARKAVRLMIAGVQKPLRPLPKQTSEASGQP